MFGSNQNTPGHFFVKNAKIVKRRRPLQSR